MVLFIFTLSHVTFGEKKKRIVLFFSRVLVAHTHSAENTKAALIASRILFVDGVIACNPALEVLLKDLPKYAALIGSTTIAIR